MLTQIHPILGDLVEYICELLLPFLCLFPLLEGVGVAAEHHADFHHLALVAGEGEGVALLVDLAQSVVGSAVAVEFVFEDVDCGLRSHDAVDAPIGGVKLVFHIASCKIEDGVEDVLKLSLIVELHRLVVHPLEECRESLHNTLKFSIL